MLSSGNFWKDLKGPLYMLAPMEDVTDTAFRELVMRISTPGLPHILLLSSLQLMDFVILLAGKK